LDRNALLICGSIELVEVVLPPFDMIFSFNPVTI
jgi:hypothetical protein